MNESSHALALGCVEKSDPGGSIALFKLVLSRRSSGPVETKLEFDPGGGVGCPELEAIEVTVDGMRPDIRGVSKVSSPGVCEFDVESGNLVWLSLVGGTQMDVSLLSHRRTGKKCSINVEGVDANALSFPNIE